jgi:CysZ protein
MISALSLSFAQLGDRKIISVFAKSMLITLVIAGLLGYLAFLGVEWAMNHSVDTVMQDDYYTVLHGLAQAIAALAVMFFSFRIVAVPVIGFFGDEVVAAVEDRHYPQASAKAQRASYGVSVRLGLMSVLRLVLVNLAALPVYIFLLITAVGPFVLFIAVNAVLLGRDMGEMVAVRHLDPTGVKQWLANSRWERAVLGLAVTLLFLVPFANLIAPIIGAAAATHLFHRRPNA